MLIHSRPGVAALGFATAFVLAACASGTAVPNVPASPAPAAPTQAATNPEPPAQPPAGEMGTFTVNDTVFAVTNLNRCIPFSDEPGNIDLQPIAQGALLNLNKSGDSIDVSLQGSAIDQEFGSMVFGEDMAVHESMVTETRWTGSATVGDSLGSGTTVDVIWDVMVPSEINDCSL